MPRTTREKILVVLTSVMIIGGLLYSQWDSLGLGGVLAAGTDDLGEMEEQYEAYLEMLDKREQINKEFANLEAPYTVKPGQMVDTAFNEQIYEIFLRNQFTANISSAWVESIEGVDEYGLIFLDVTQSAGTSENAVHLLKELDTKGFLIRSLKMEKTVSQIDSPTLFIDMEVGRPVKMDEVERLVRRRR